ncbi:MAG: ComF family protein [Thermodesulfobacteriota bacterium]
MRWLDQLSALGDSVLGVVFPQYCDFCNGPLDDDPSIPLCNECQAGIERIPEPVCDRCGLPLPPVRAFTQLDRGPDGVCVEVRAEEEAAGTTPVPPEQSDQSVYGPARATCPACILAPPPYHRAGFSVVYAGLVKEGVARFKYNGRLHLRRSLSELLLEGFGARYSPMDFDFVVPVPVHWKKLRTRGFNPALLLASDLASRIRLPLHRRVLLKTRHTKAQVGLSRAERIRNLAGSFGVSDARQVSGRRILLVDDVSTTGTTIREAATVLTSAGAARVDVLALAARFTGGTPGRPSPKAT